MSGDLAGSIPIYSSSDDYDFSDDSSHYNKEIQDWENVSNSDYIKWEATLENKERYDSDQEPLID